MMRQSYGAVVKKYFIGFLVLSFCLFTAASSQAVSLVWDPGLSGAGTSGGIGNWNVTATPLLNWYDAAALPVPADVAWTSDYDAVFGTTGGAVTIVSDGGAGVTAQSLTFNVAGYSIGGDKLILNGTPTITANSDATINSVIDGTLGFTKAGAGRLTLAAATGNTYTGDTTISVGTLLYSNTNQLSAGGTNNIVFNGTGTLGTLAGITEARNITMTTAGTIDTWGNNSTFSGVISGSGALTKAGNGSLTLSGANVGYSGQTNINGGTLNIGNANALGTGPVNFNGGSIDNLTGGVLSVANQVLMPNRDIGFGGSNNLTFTNTTDIAFSGWNSINLNGSGKTLQFDAAIKNSANSDRLLNVNGAGNTLILGGLTTRNSTDTGWRSFYLGGSADIVFNGPITDGADTGHAGEPYFGGTASITLGGSTANWIGTTTNGAIRLESGKLVLNYTGGYVSKLQDAQDLRIYGTSTLDLKDDSSVPTAYTEVITNLNINNNANARVGALHLTRSSGLVTIRLKALNIGAGGLLDVAQSNIADTTNGNTNNILVPNGRSSVTVGGADWGAADVTATNHLIIALPAYDAFTGTGGAGTENASILDSALSTTTGNYTIQTLKIAPSTGGGSLTLGTSDTLKLNAGGLLLASTSGTYSITGGQIQSGQNPGDLMFLANGSSTLAIG
ncbi:MAG: autotransporter-associated beta strand repeat-containing protein, partial [Thermoguttaceae bacterium]